VSKGSLSADLWVRNLFDEEYIPIAFQPNPGDSSLFVGESGAPRTYGFTLRLSF
jgi:outer membrane receptor protein involved in Fe transport